MNSELQPEILVNISDYPQKSRKTDEIPCVVCINSNLLKEKYSR